MSRTDDRTCVVPARKKLPGVTGPGYADHWSLDRNLTNFHKSGVVNPAGAYAPTDESGNATVTKRQVWGHVGTRNSHRGGHLHGYGRLGITD